MRSNLPIKDIEATKRYFDNYFKAEYNTSASAYDALVTFFSRQTSNMEAANSIATSILEACRNGNLNPMEILDTLRASSTEQQNQYLIAIMNTTRSNSSYMGFKNTSAGNRYITRTILS